MARNRFRGDAAAVRQISKFQVTGAGAVNDTVVVTINRKVVTAIVPAAPTAATVAAAIAAALAAATAFLEIQEATWTSDSGGWVYGTSATAGSPFGPPTVAVTGTVTVGAVTTPTVNAGPNCWSTAGNWSLNTPPVTGDDVDLIDCNVDIKWDLDQNGVTLASLNIYSSYTGRIGLPSTNVAGYFEFREQYLKISTTLCTIGIGLGSGSAMIKLNTGTNATTIDVVSTGTPQTQGAPVLWWIGVNGANVVTINSGYVGLAYELETVATVGTINVGQSTVGPIVQMGVGLTWTTVNAMGGTTYALSGGTTLTTFPGAKFYTTGVANCNITTWNGSGGTFVPNAPGIVGTSTMSGAELDMTQDPRAKTFTNMTANHGSIINDPDKRIAWTNPASYPDGIQSPLSQKGAIVNFGNQITLQRA